MPKTDTPIVVERQVDKHYQHRGSSDAKRKHSDDTHSKSTAAIGIPCCFPKNGAQFMETLRNMRFEASGRVSAFRTSFCTKSLRMCFSTYIEPLGNKTQHNNKQSRKTNKTQAPGFGVPVACFCCFWGPAGAEWDSGVTGTVLSGPRSLCCWL